MNENNKNLQGKKKITIDEVAKKAHVSIATVSRIINNKDQVTEKTRQHVLRVMDEMDFVPKNTKALFSATSNVILLLIPDFENPFNAAIISGIQESAREHDMDVFVVQTKNYYTEHRHFINILKNNSIAGIIILAPAPHKSLLDELCHSCPVVMCSEYAEDYGVSYVTINDIESAKSAVNYLISTGRRKIGLINSNLKYKYARHRERGYKQALETAGLEIREDFIAHISAIDYSSALSSATHILGLPDRPDAFFAVSDVFATGVIVAAKKLGLRVPEDVSVVGFDNIELSNMTEPPITTIEQPAHQLGYQAAEMLIEKIRKPDMADKQIILDTHLVVRGSTTLSSM